MIPRAHRARFLAVATAVLVPSCTVGAPCGPARARVARVIDGDTILLEDGDRVRYLLVDAPETTGAEVECYGPEATRFNRDLVEHREVDLLYDVECRDRYGRLLAHIFVDGLDVGAALVERGYACVLHIPPNGEERIAELRVLEADARRSGRGLWEACPRASCAR